MKRVYVLGSLLFSLLLSGCGENLLAGGASLGGTGGGVKPGTGAGVDEGNGSQNPVDQRPIQEKEVFKYITYNLPLLDYCGSVQRRIYFMDSQGLPVDQSVQEEYADRVQVKVELTNTASYPVYEKQRDCHAAFEVLDVSDGQAAAIVKPRRTLTCEGGESWRILQPQQTLTYIFEAGDNYLSDDITLGRIQQFKVAYSPVFVQQPGQGFPAATANTLSCAAQELSFNTVNKIRSNEGEGGDVLDEQGGPP